MSSAVPYITGVRPPYAVPGGRLTLAGEGFEPTKAHDLRVYVGDVRAQITRVSRKTLSLVVPVADEMPSLRVELNGQSSDPFPLSLARTLAEELNPVANPVFDREGNLLVTFSGSRGEKVPVSVYRIDSAGNMKPFLSEIINPTGMAFDREGVLHVSSRHEGTVYRVGPDRDVELIADELGIATGLAFDPEGILYVGDRQGTVFRIEPNGEPRAFCRLPPSVAAYHLAFDVDGNLYVTGPSLSSVDPIYRVGSDGKVENFCHGFGRPQGMAFDTDGNLYVTEALAGDSGVFRVRPDGERERLVAGPPLVGLAFDGRGGLVLAGTGSVFFLDLGVRGRALC